MSCCACCRQFYGCAKEFNDYLYSLRRTFPKRDELLRSLLNADLIGFHTFDYARHFLSCCSRMLGLEHETSRGSISIEYYGRNVGLKIMPTGERCCRVG